MDVLTDTLSILTVAQCLESSRSLIGGKAANLARMHSWGFHVPPFAVLPSDLWNMAAGTGDTDTQRAAIKAFLFPDDLREQVDTLFHGCTRFAVRSSATDEDGAANSFAGQFLTRLNVSPDELPEAVREVWLSALSEGVTNYRTHQGMIQASPMAVIIMPMLEPEVSGVGFGMDPVSGDRQVKVISALYGLGEGLVSGELSADTWRLNNGIQSEELVPKTRKVTTNGNNTGTHQEDVAAHLSAQPSLNKDQLHELEAILHKLYILTGHYADIEFAVCKGEIILLQVRPVTTGSRQSDPGGVYQVWDNSNIVESYPGITSPLTFSFIIKLYSAVYRQFFGIMGVREERIEESRYILDHMLGHLQGRVYYNLLSWYKALALLPGYRLNARFMEIMMGVKERFDLPESAPTSKLSAYKDVTRAIWGMMGNLRRLPAERRRFLAELEQELGKYYALDWDRLRPEEIMAHYRALEKTLLQKWRPPLVNDFFAMIFFGMLPKLLEKWGIDKDGSLHNDLLCGAGDIVSTEPVRITLALVQSIEANPAAKALFADNSPEVIWRRLENGEFPDVLAQARQFLHRFGDRSVGELKLENITYRQDPPRYIQLVRNYLGQPGELRQPGGGNEKQIRKAAEEKVKQALRGKPVRQRLFRYVLAKARDLVSNRENLRLERTRAFGMVRTMYNALGRRFQAEGVLIEAKDIFFLTQEEIANFIEGTQSSLQLQAIVAQRKTEYAEFEKQHMPERIVTYGAVNIGNNFEAPPAGAEALTADLQGLGCCAGRVQARVKVIHRPEDAGDIFGHILVTASTDPGWVSLFPLVKGILVERGSLLSHSAIVSREMGIPCVVGISHLLQNLRTGDLVEMDGATGKVRIIERNDKMVKG